MIHYFLSDGRLGLMIGTIFGWELWKAFREQYRTAKLYPHRWSCPESSCGFSVQSTSEKLIEHIKSNHEQVVDHIRQHPRA